MTTKAQERKALEQIINIVEGLGEGSYLSMAFDGCFEMAESNIDNDFGNSPKEAITTLRKKYEEAKAEADDKREAYKMLNDRFDAVMRNHEKEIDKKNEMIMNLQDERDDAQRIAMGNECMIKDLEETLKERETEIIQLKAKLYDFMIKEAR